MSLYCYQVTVNPDILSGPVDIRAIALTAPAPEGRGGGMRNPPPSSVPSLMAILTTVHRYPSDPGKQTRSGASLIRGGDKDQNQNWIPKEPSYPGRSVRAGDAHGALSHRISMEK